MVEPRRRSVYLRLAIGTEVQFALTQIPARYIVAGIAQNLHIVEEARNEIAPFLVDEDADISRRS